MREEGKEEQEGYGQRVTTIEGREGERGERISVIAAKDLQSTFVS